MSQTQGQPPWIDALSGNRSPTGNRCDYLGEAISRWASSLGSVASDGEPSPETIGVLTQIASNLRELTGHDDSVIASCLTGASGEELLQWVIVLCRRHHQARSAAQLESGPSDDSHAPRSRCLAAIGSEHGTEVVGRMLSGQADLRDPAWPLVPGFLHAPVETLHQRIDDSVAMVLIAPLQRGNQMRPVPPESMQEIRAACDRHGAALVIDHRDIPPQGDGCFWIHDSLAGVTAEAVLMSAGLTGTDRGGLLVLNRALAKNVGRHLGGETEMLPSPYVAQLVASTLQQWRDNHSWPDVKTDEFAASLAERLATRECVRDLHVTGRSIGIELDLPSVQWQRAAADVSLRVSTAGEFGIALQPPLVLSSDEQSELLMRIDLVFDRIERVEQNPHSLGVDDEAENETDEEVNEERMDDPEKEIEDSMDEDTVKSSPIE